MASINETYRDDGRLRGQDRVGVEIFLSDNDRAQITGRGVPFFSGREREISVFRKVADALSLGRQGNATIVVEGPPGAGKSALMCQFMEDMRSLPSIGRRRWLPVPLLAGHAESPPEVADAIDEAIVAQLAADLLATRKASPKQPGETAGLVKKLSEYWGGDINLAGATAKAKEFFDRGGSLWGFSLGASRQGAPQSISEAARRRAAWQSWQIILMIDEAQGIRPGQPHAGEGTLGALHQGIVRAPVSFCAFGLPGTLAALADAGVSRLTSGRAIRLGGLDDTAARHTVNRCFNAFGVANGRSWGEAILGRSANWPQHLAVYLNAAIGQIFEKSPNSMDAGRADLAAAMRLGDQGREAYYGQRLARINRHHGGFEAVAMALVPDFRERGGRLPYRALFSRVEEIMRRTPDLSAASATQFIRDAEQAGFLCVESDLRSCSMPIPSFAGILLGEALPDPRVPVPAGDDGPKGRI